MAMDTLPAGVRPAKPTYATRRTLLCGMASVPALIAVGCPGPASAASGGVAAAIAAARHAEAKSAAFSDRVYQPLYSQIQKQIDALPPTVIGYTDDAGFDHEMRTGEDFSQWFLDHYRRKTPYITTAQPGWRQEAIAAFDEGERARDTRIAELRADTRLRQAFNRSEQLSEATYDAALAVVTTRPTTIGELVDKVSYLNEIDWWEEAREELVADVQRLAREA